MIRSTISKLLTILTKQVRKTNWWNNRYALVGQFMPQPLFRASYVRNYDSLCVGGESAAFAIQIENGLNLASRKTTMQLIFDIIKFLFLHTVPYLKYIPLWLLIPIIIILVFLFSIYSMFILSKDADEDMKE